MIQFFQNLLCNLDNADVYHVPLERLDSLVYPELQKAQVTNHCPEFVSRHDKISTEKTQVFIS